MDLLLLLIIALIILSRCARMTLRLRGVVVDSTSSTGAFFPPKMRKRAAGALALSCREGIC